MSINKGLYYPDGEEVRFEDKDCTKRVKKINLKPKQTRAEKLLQKMRFTLYWTTSGKGTECPKINKPKHLLTTRDWCSNKQYIGVKLRQLAIIKLILRVFYFLLMRSQISIFDNITDKGGVTIRAKAVWCFYEQVKGMCEKDEYWWSDIHLCSPAATRYMLTNWCSLKDVPRYIRCLRYISKNLPNDWNIKVKSRNEFWFELITHRNEIKDLVENKQRFSQLKKDVLAKKWKNMKDMSEYIDRKISRCGPHWTDCTEQQNRAFDDLCQLIFGREFKNKYVAAALAEEYLDYDKLMVLKNSWKKFMYIFNQFAASDMTSHDHSIRAIANLACKFSYDDLVWINKVQTVKMDDFESKLQYWHDAWQTLLEVPVSRMFIMRRHDHIHADLAKALAKIPMADIDLKLMSTSDIMKLAAKYRYRNVLDDKLATLAASCDLSQWSFDSFQEHWMDNKSKLKDNKTIPAVVVNEDAYKMYRLDYDDPRGLILGHYTNCCQSIGNAGESCAIHGTYDENGCFYVVEKSGKIVAQSWAWRRGNVVCFDNIEALSDNYMGRIATMYKKVGEGLVNNKGIEVVVVGSGHDDLGVKEYFKLHDFLYSSPKGVYSDAQTDQYLIASVVK